MKLVALIQLRQRNGLRTYGVFDKKGNLLRRETQLDCGQGAAQAREVVSRLYKISGAEWVYKLAQEKVKAGLSLPEVSKIAGAKVFAISNLALCSSLHLRGLPFTFTNADWTPKDEAEIINAFRYCAFEEEIEQALEEEFVYWLKELKKWSNIRLLMLAIDHHAVDIKED